MSDEKSAIVTISSRIGTTVSGQFVVEISLPGISSEIFGPYESREIAELESNKIQNEIIRRIGEQL